MTGKIRSGKIRAAASGTSSPALQDAAPHILLGRSRRGHESRGVDACLDSAARPPPVAGQSSPAISNSCPCNRNLPRVFGGPSCGLFRGAGAHSHPCLMQSEFLVALVSMLIGWLSFSFGETISLSGKGSDLATTSPYPPLSIRSSSPVCLGSPIW